MSGFKTFRAIIEWHRLEKPKKSGMYLVLVEEDRFDYSFSILLFDSKNDTWRDPRIDPSAEAFDEFPKELIQAWTYTNELSYYCDRRGRDVIYHRENDNERKKAKN